MCEASLVTARAARSAPLCGMQGWPFTAPQLSHGTSHLASGYSGDRVLSWAARHGRSMEAEMRAILTDAVSEPEKDKGLFGALLDRFGALGGVELELPVRSARPRAADLG